MEKNYNVLIVDDEADIAEFIIDEIEEMGIESKHCNSVEEAQALIAEMKPTIVFSDFRMPNGGGEALLNFCQKDNFYKGYFYFVTGNMDLTHEVVTSMGADGVLYKPIDWDKLKDIVNLHKD